MLLQVDAPKTPKREPDPLPARRSVLARAFEIVERLDLDESCEDQNAAAQIDATRHAENVATTES